ncbi:hypothetical protein PENSPDRAFT_736913 [Peniophora sp. CONT]|nr:hypothetical protein PENSPDRAFT_736913 [Peniophora sp. CONT]
MSDARETPRAQAAFSELDLFREQWQAELRQRPTKRLARLGDAVEPEPLDPSRPVVAIWTLPDDVLCEIFYAVASLLPPASMEPVEAHLRDRYMAYQRYMTDQHRLPRGGLGWIRLTHVCQRWRDILLGTGMARLWGRVAFAYPSSNAFPTLLARSRNALADVFLHTTPGAGPHMSFEPLRMQAALETLPRAWSLKLHTSVSHNLLSLFSEPLHAPRLQELNLVFEYGRTPWARDVFEEGAAVPTATDISFEGPNVEMASIQLLRLRTGSILLPRLNFMLPSLRRLAIGIHDDTRAHISDLRWLVSLLRTSTLLETLSLDIHFDGHAPDWDTVFTGPAAELSHMRWITLADCWTVDLAPFIARICPTPPASIRASCEMPRNEDLTGDVPQQTIAFIRGFGGYLCRPGHVALHVTAAHSTDPHVYHVIMQSTPALDDSVALKFPPPELSDRHLQADDMELSRLPDTVRIKLSVPILLSAGHIWFETLSSRIGNNELVEQLYLRVPTEIRGDWMKACRQYLLLPMTAVRCLYILEPIDVHYPERVVDAWKEAIDILRPTEFPLFPALHTLLVDFCAGTFIDHASPQSAREWWEPLVQVLEQRHARGCPVHTLRIAGGWSQHFKTSMQELDAQMRARVMAVVNGIVDERIVFGPKGRTH